MYYVYVLKSQKNGRRYVGSTDNVQKRLTEHNSGKSKYTRSTRPFELIYSEGHQSRSEAVRRELFLKSGQGRSFLDKLLDK